ncbi:DNA-directed RNA polymerase [Vibrio phage VP-HS15]|uniref:DNA-directed RNA polymerase n=1 Tax=Vibrio phage VP-HS15 TaxID=2686284 RepID=A0A6B9LQZ7_9CAUD|nr:DNA-directed RNA polymerase [Vibrio phage VP-HS15]
MNKDLMQIQLELEAEMHGAGILRFEKNNQRALESGNGSDADWYRRLTREFVRPMADAIQAYIDYYTGRRGKPSACLMHLKCLSPEAAAYIAIKTIFDGLSNHEITAQNLANNIGRRIEDEVRFTKLNNAAPKYIQAIKESLKKRNSNSYKFDHDVMVHAEKELKLLADFQALLGAGEEKLEIMRLLSIDNDKYQHLLDKAEFAIDIDRWIPWSDNDVIQLGAKLIEIFGKNMLMDGQPLIAKQVNGQGRGKTTAKIVATDALETWIQGYKEVVGNMSPAYEPCVVPPKEWKSPFNGGYHSKEVSSNLPIAKVRDKKHLRRLTRKQMPKVYQALNALQNVKWQINPSIYAIANEIRLRELPLGMPEFKKYNKPACPVPAIYSDLRGEDLMQVLDDDQKAAFKNWKRQIASIYAKENKRKSDVREVVATLDQANKFKDFENLHFVYTLDFRGRVYCHSSLVSPQGGDLQKALIRFADSMPLGSTGAYWFKVHGANVWGWDKETFAERVSRCETEEFKEMCLDISADPITFTDWTKADKPWQFLAWCYEYAALLEWIDEGNNEQDFPSHIAVAMDGSCSGIQHYSAMLRDSVGGKEVNLLPSDKPQDIYGAVSKVVVEWMEAITNNDERDCPIYDKLIDSLVAKFEKAKLTGDLESKARIMAYKFCEEWLRIGVTRSMTKKPVMTLPYGSSQLTCRDSIADYLKDLQEKADNKARARGMKAGNIHAFTDSDGDLPLRDAISFASMLTWAAIGEVVVAARAGMKYIKEVCTAIAKDNKPLEWMTPTGFIVKQAVYEVKEDKRIKTQMLGETFFRTSVRTDKIDPRRMASSAAPNFVHSMDASHLVLAVCAFEDNGITSIAVIHDSFGTHAGNTELLRLHLSGSFVQMYEENDVIKDFIEYNEALILTEIEATVPEKGELDLQEVLKSLYCFA